MKKAILFLMATLSAMASCQKEQNAGTENNGSREIVFTTGEGRITANVETKAATALSSLPSFNVLCVKGTLGSNETSIFNVEFSGSDNNYTGGQFWPCYDKGYKFYASNAALTFSATGATIAATNNTDILCALCSSPTYMSSNPLSFQHIFARIGSCNITAPENYTVKNLTVKITPLISGTYSLLTGDGKSDGSGWTGTKSGDELTITDTVSDTSDHNIYLVPGSYELSLVYDLEQGAYAETFTKKATISLTGGKINNISATLPQGAAAALSFTVSFAEWGSQDVTVSL